VLRDLGEAEAVLRRILDAALGALVGGRRSWPPLPDRTLFVSAVMPYRFQRWRVPA